MDIKTKQTLCTIEVDRRQFQHNNNAQLSHNSLRDSLPGKFYLYPHRISQRTESMRELIKIYS